MTKTKIKWFNIIIIVVLLAAILTYFIYPKVIDFIYSDNDAMPDSVVAVANGETIFYSDISDAIRTFPEDVQMKVNRSFILDQTINEIILIDMIDEMNITISENEYEGNFTLFLAQNEMNISEFDEILSLNDLSKEKFEKDFKEKLALDKILNDYILANVTVSDEEILGFYENNTNLFVNQTFEDVKDFIKENMVGIARIKAFNAYMLTKQSAADVRDYRYEEACEAKDILFYSNGTNLAEDFNNIVFVKQTEKDLVSFCIGNIENTLPVIICGDKIFEVSSKEEVEYSVNLC